MSNPIKSTTLLGVTLLYHSRNNRSSSLRPAIFLSMGAHCRIQSSCKVGSDARPSMPGSARPVFLLLSCWLEVSWSAGKLPVCCLLFRILRSSPLAPTGNDRAKSRQSVGDELVDPAQQENPQPHSSSLQLGGRRHQNNKRSADVWRKRMWNLWCRKIVAKLSLS